jgi:hypothetical protein
MNSAQDVLYISALQSVSQLLLKVQRGRLPALSAGMALFHLSSFQEQSQWLKLLPEQVYLYHFVHVRVKNQISLQ